MVPVPSRYAHSPGYAPPALLAALARLDPLAPPRPTPPHPASSRLQQELRNPATNEVVCLVPESTQAEMDEATASCAEAFKTWRDVPVQTRARVMFKFQNLIEEHTDEIAHAITLEQGKTLPDARGDVFRGFEVVEQCCNMPSQMLGEASNQNAANLDISSLRQPLGVCAGIAPFNFPAMIPLWMFPVAVTCGNTFLLKPSEKDPGAAMILTPRRQASRTAPSTSSTAPTTPSNVSDTRRTSRPFRLSAATRPASTSTTAGRTTASACRPTSAPKTMRASCPTPTRTRSSPP